MSDEEISAGSDGATLIRLRHFEPEMEEILDFGTVCSGGNLTGNLKSQTTNLKQVPITQIPNMVPSNIHRLGHLNLRFGYCLLFGAWTLVFMPQAFVVCGSQDGQVPDEIGRWKC